MDEFGRNEVESVARVSIWLRIFTEFTTFFLGDPLGCGGARLLRRVERSGPGHGALGCAIVVVIVVSGLFSFWQEYRAEQTLARSASCCRSRSQVVRDGKWCSCRVEELVPGDIVLLEQGDNVPADCRLIEAFGVRVDNATITGESLPQARDAEPARTDELIHSRNILLAGTSLVSGQAQGGRVRDRHAHRVRQDRAPHADRAATPSRRCGWRSRT